MRLTKKEFWDKVQRNEIVLYAENKCYLNGVKYSLNSSEYVDEVVLKKEQS